MTYTDSFFLFAFLPIAIIGYNIFPKKFRGVVLLALSYLFFLIISRKLIIYLIGSTLVIYVFSLIVKKLQKNRDIELEKSNKENRKKIKEKCEKKQRIILILSILINLSILIILKYSKFLGDNLNFLFENMDIQTRINVLSFVLPIGISFYTLQAISYSVDVHRGLIKPDTNLGRLALYLSFFPQIMEGPICRYQDTAQKLWSGERTTYKGLTFGLQRMALGLGKKIIIADRLNIIVNEIFNNYTNYDGGIIAIGMVLYTLQLYMDFSGVMDIAIGIGEIFNVKLPENFKQPFFSKSISEFWTRWHITLGTFLRDYIYYPVSMSKAIKKLTTTLRKKIGNYYGPLITSTLALFLVWLANGIWHGAAWNFIFYGMYHFTLILLGRIFEPLNKKILKKLHINSEKTWFKIWQIIRTVLLVLIGELFFRANGLRAGINMFTKMTTNFSFEAISNGSLLKMGLDYKDFIIVMIFTIIFFIISILKEKGIDIREKVSSKKIIIRWSIYLVLILSIVIFGAYGIGYIPVNPMYANY